MPIQSTKQLVEVANIIDSIVLLKNGSLRSIIEVSAINFELRSEGEQIAILQNFQRFVNSIDFPLQIVIHSRKLNIDEYLKLIDQSFNTLANELLKIQAEEYSKFITELSDLSNIMSKKFYIVVPFYVFEAPSKSGIMQSFKSILKPSAVVKELTPEQLETYKSQLLQRTELIFDGLIGMGLKTKTLEKEELFAPSAFNISPNYFQIGNKYARTIFLATYPRYLQTNWFSPIINLDRVLDISVFILPKNTATVLKQLRDQLARLESQAMEEASRGKVRDPMLETGIQEILC